MCVGKDHEFFLRQRHNGMYCILRVSQSRGTLETMCSQFLGHHIWIKGFSYFDFPLMPHPLPYLQQCNWQIEYHLHVLKILHLLHICRWNPSPTSPESHNPWHSNHNPYPSFVVQNVYPSCHPQGVLLKWVVLSKVAIEARPHPNSCRFTNALR